MSEATQRRQVTTRRGVFGAACLCTLGLVALLGSSAPAAPAAEAFPGQGFLPDSRAWEMVSPPQKNGADIGADSGRTRAAADGDALGFISVGAFGDAIGTGVATDYLAQRSTATEPGDNGWSTHAVTPQLESVSLQGILANLEPNYVGEFSADLNAGVFFSPSPITEEPNVAQSLNIYRRDDLRTPGAGSYQLLSECPRCESAGPLLPSPIVGRPNPRLAGASTDLSHVLFESEALLTPDTPETAESMHVFEWSAGQLRLAGRIPVAPQTECDDAGVPVCVPAEVSIAGQGAGTNNGTTHGFSRSPHTISDGSDGQSLVFFTTPTDSSGTSPQPEAAEGNVFMRLDAARTVQLNVSERNLQPATAFARARFLDATASGSRAYFSTTQALTDDAPENGNVKLYAYDTTKPASAPDNLTFLNHDSEPADQGSLRAFVGASADGDYVYMAGSGQLVSGKLKLNNKNGIYLWHDGQITYIGNTPNAGGPLAELQSAGTNWTLVKHLARVTPDGKHLLFPAINGAGLPIPGYPTGYPTGSCGSGCRQLYLYSAESDQLRCASCDPGGAVPTTMAEGEQRQLSGGTQTSWHENHILSADGRYVFFSTGERLVGEDHNGTTDAYVYDSVAARPFLLSSGESASPSFFLDASADGRDAFFDTNERLSGWDVDGAYDVYDARVDGGFPEPAPPPPSCQGDACQPAPTALNDPTPGSASVSGPGNESTTRKAKARCAKGQRKVKARSGKSRCVKSKAHKKAKKYKRGAKSNRRAGK